MATDYSSSTQKLWKIETFSLIEHRFRLNRHKPINYKSYIDGDTSTTDELSVDRQQRIKRNNQIEEWKR